MRATYTNPTFGKLAYRCSRYGIGFEIDTATGRSARVYTLEHTRDGYIKRDEIMVQGATPLEIAVRIADTFTPLDDELLALWSAWLEDEIERTVFLARQEMKLCAEIDLLAEALRV